MITQGLAGWALWERGFRPFFLLASGCALILVPAWLAVLGGLLPAPGRGSPPAWHGHEMVFGFATAAVAGFLLTSVPVWTGRPPVIGARLAGLAALWLAGRVVVLLAARLPPALVVVTDVAFPIALAALLAPALLVRGQRRNHGFVAILLALALANALSYRHAAGTLGLRAGIDLLGLLVVIVGGRITPAFTVNALRRAGRAEVVRMRPWADRLAVGAVVALAALDLLAPRSSASGAAAALAAFAVFARMSGWQSLRTRADPLLWSLHAGQAWAGLGFTGLALADLTGWIPVTVGLHALTAGAFGAMILAVMTRVSLGHTGRALSAPRGIALCYALVNIGAMLRVLAPFALASWGLLPLVLSGLLWSGAFAIFLWVYAPILVRPRLDGMPG